jgi:hypothetical protein
MRGNSTITLQLPPELGEKLVEEWVRSWVTHSETPRPQPKV